MSTVSSETARHSSTAPQIARPPEDILHHVLAHVRQLPRDIQECFRTGRELGTYGASTVIGRDGTVFFHWLTPRDSFHERKPVFEAICSLVRILSGVVRVDVEPYSEPIRRNGSPGGELVGERWTIRTVADSADRPTARNA